MTFFSRSSSSGTKDGLHFDRNLRAAASDSAATLTQPIDKDYRRFVAVFLAGGRFFCTLLALESNATPFRKPHASRSVNLPR
jgi:hypothetical protein